MNTTRVLLTCLLMVFWAGSAAAQDLIQQSETGPLASEAPSLRFEHLKMADGLAQQSLNDMMQDSQGFLWFATQGGLHRYDGYSFKVYSKVPFDTTSLPTSYVWGVAEAANGDIWVANDAAGVSRLDRATDTFTTYRHDPADSTSLSSDGTAFVYEDSRGDVWVGTFSEGFNRMRADAPGRFEHFRHDPDDPTTLGSDDVFFITEDTEGFVWVGSGNGTNRINPFTGEVTRYLHEPGVETRYRSPQNVVSHYHPPGEASVAWLATGRGLARLDVASGEVERFPIITPADASENLLHEIVPDPDQPDILWVAGPRIGLARFDVRTETYTVYEPDERDPNSLSSSFVQTLFLDRTGTVWVGTGDQGLSHFNVGAVNFAHLRHDSADRNSIAQGTVWGMYEDRGGHLWVSTATTIGLGALSRVDLVTGDVTRYESQGNGDAGIFSNPIYGIVEDDEGRVWVGGTERIARIDPTTGAVLSIDTPGRRYANLERSINDPNIIWGVGLGETGLTRLDLRTETVEHITLNVEGLPREPFIADMVEWTDGTLWLASRDGLIRRDPDGEATLVAAHDPADPTTIASNALVALLESERDPGALWIATIDGGISRYDIATGTATHHVNTANGLPNDTIYALMEDDSGTFWLSTNGGLVNYNPETEDIRVYGLDDGLIALEYSEFAFAKGAGGVLYFGSNFGVTAFIPERLSINTVAPQVALTDFKLFNESVKVGSDSPLQAALADTEAITLRHDQNEVTFDFVGLHFADPEQNTYAYRLDGFDADWVEAGTQRTSTYTNLAPGTYTFRAKAANGDGVWNEEGVSLELTILPPWWQTWWAYLIYGGLLAGAVYGGAQLLRKRVEAQERAQAQVRELEQARQLEKTHALLEQSHSIVASINQETSFRRLLHTILTEARAIPGVEKATALVYAPEHEVFTFRATVGWDLEQIQQIRLTEAEAEARYIHQAEEVAEDIFVAKDLEQRAGNERFAAFGLPASFMVLRIRTDGRTTGYFIFDNMTRPDAFDARDVELLEGLREHVRSAFIKTQLLEHLRDRNDAISAQSADLERAVHHLKETQAQLVQQEKMASLGALTAGIAHEIKNPLNFINNFAEVNEELTDELREDLEDHPDVLSKLGDLLVDLKQNAAMIARHGKRADGIVKSMMAHARSDSGEKRSVDLNALVAEHVDLAYHGKRATTPDFSIEITRQLSDEVGSVAVIPQDLGRVVLNLVGNAFDAMLEAQTPEPTVTVSTERQNGHVAIRVSDNGPGMPEAVREKVFEPFFTTKPAGSGTGLGLSLSYDIVTQGHGGTMRVESASGKGTTFSVVLPTEHTS
ncbi:MAG: two-component regulator propeller domain-containing protein [Bacteroidota bacterium]